MHVTSGACSGSSESTCSCRLCHSVCWINSRCTETEVETPGNCRLMLIIHAFLSRWCVSRWICIHVTCTWPEVSKHSAQWELFFLITEKPFAANTSVLLISRTFYFHHKEWFSFCFNWASWKLSSRKVEDGSVGETESHAKLSVMRIFSASKIILRLHCDQQQLTQIHIRTSHWPIMSFPWRCFKS